MGWRRGLVMGVNGCRPLSTPYVLWDTREWNGALGLGTRGLPNLGIGGSEFDLDVYSVAYSYSGSPGTATYASHGNGTWQAPNPFIDWSNVGGHPCDGGAFTQIVAYGAFPGSPDYCEADILFSTTSGSSGQFGISQGIGSLTSFPAGAADNGSFVNTFTGFEYGLWSAPQTEVAGNAVTYLKNKMITVTHDSVFGNYTAYRDTAQIVNTISGTSDEVDGFASVDGCSAFDPSSVLTDDYHFFYCGEDRRLGASNPPPVGDPWTGIVGCALFRGCPTQADIAYWMGYFYGA